MKHKTIFREIDMFIEYHSENAHCKNTTGYHTNGAVNLTSLPEGIYLLRVHLPNGAFAKSKIIKN